MLQHQSTLQNTVFIFGEETNYTPRWLIAQGLTQMYLRNKTSGSIKLSRMTFCHLVFR